MQVNLTDSSDNIHSTSSNSRQHTLTLGSLWNTMRTRTPQQGRIQDFSEGGAPYEKWGEGQFASGPIGGGGGGGGSPLQVRYTKSGGGNSLQVRYEKWGGSPLQVRYTKSGGGGGGQSTSGPIYKKWGGGGGGGGGNSFQVRYEKWGGGGGNSLLVSYPDPYVRNDDHRLQYDITYRGSGNKVVRNGSSATKCSGMAEAIQHWSGLGVAIKFFYIDSCHTS